MANTTLRAYLNDLKALLEREALEEVIGHCRHIIQHFPKNIEAYRTLGSALLERGRHAEAADVFQRVLGAVPDDFTAHVGLGSAYEESNVKAAIWHLERALEQEPTHQALQDELSRLITVRDGAAPASFHLTRGALARVYLKSQLYNQAIIELQAALQENKERIDLAVLLARTLWMSGHPVEASEIALQILRTYPDNVEANRIMAALWLAAGRPSDAEPFIARLELLDPFLAWETLHPDGTPVPRDAFQLPRLQWDARTAAAMDASLPDWVSSIGDVFEAQEEAASAFAPGVGPVVAPWSDDASLDFNDALTPATSADALPDWLNDVVEPAAEPPSVQASSPVAEAFADYTPDWLDDDEPPAITDVFDAMGGLAGDMPGGAQRLEETLDWLPADSGQPASQGATDRLPPLDEFDIFAAPTPSEAPAADDIPPDFAEDALSWLSTGSLSAQDAAPSSAPSAPRGRQPGETGPLTMLPPPTGPLGAPAAPPQEPVEPPPTPRDDDSLSWLQTASLPAPDSEAAPALDFSAFESALEGASGAPPWFDEGALGGPAAASGDADQAEMEPGLETSAELLGDIEEVADLWGALPEPSESSALVDATPPSEADMSFDSGWLDDLGVAAPTSAPEASPGDLAAEPDLPLDFSAFAADLGEPLDLGDVTAAPGGDWLSGLDGAPGEGPGDTAPDLDLDAWTAGAPQPEIAPGSEIPGWLSELRSADQPADASARAPESGAPVAETGPGADAAFGEEISLESLDLGWLRGETPPAQPAEATSAASAEFDSLSDLFLDEEPAHTVSAADLPALDEESAVEGEQADMLSWMRQVGILQGQPQGQPEAPAGPPADQPTADQPIAELPLEAGPPSAPVPAEGSVTEADVLAFLRDTTTPGVDLYARLNAEEAARAGGQMPGQREPEPEPPAPTVSAPLPDVQEPVLEDDFLAAFEVGVSSAPTGTAADGDDWLSTLGRESAADEPLGDDWLSQISRRAPAAPLEEPPPVEPVSEEPAPPPAQPLEDVPLWQRPAVTASLAQASAAMDLFSAEEPLVSEDDIPAWMREAGDELLVSPTDSTPIAAQDEPGARGLLNFTPQADAASRPRMDTGILEPEQTPEWLAALATDEDAAPEAESSMAQVEDAQPDWLSAAAPGEIVIDEIGIDELGIAAAPSTPDAVAEPEPGPASRGAGSRAGLGMDWLDNVFPTGDSAVDEPGEQVEAADMPAWMQEMGLTPPGQSADAGSRAPSGPALIPLEELDFSALELGAPDSGPVGEADPAHAAEAFDFLAGLGPPPGEPVAKAADLADTTHEADAAGRESEPPAPSRPTTRFSFDKEPAWKRKRHGSDGAP
ncbi:MAG: tetratricopeptide repeat protein [Anaerolineae bacterium]|nr:tetratricopeptide repeat protein [Anaerolineae bacterium]